MMNVFKIVRAGAYLLLTGNMIISYYHALELERALVGLPDPLPHVWVVSLDLVFILSVIVLAQSRGRGWLPWLFFLFGLAFTGWSNIRESVLRENIEGVIVNGSTVAALLLLELLLRWMERNREKFGQEEEKQEDLPKASQENGESQDADAAFSSGWEYQESSVSYWEDKRRSEETPEDVYPAFSRYAEDVGGVTEELSGGLATTPEDVAEKNEERTQETDTSREEIADAVRKESEERRNAAPPAEEILPEDSPATPEAEENDAAKEESTGESPGEEKGEEDIPEKSPESEETQERSGGKTPADDASSSSSSLDPFEWALNYFEENGVLPSRTKIMEATGVKEWPARQARSKVKKLVTNKKAI